MSHQITIICDSCESEFMMEPDMELPPYWFGIQLALANKDGLIGNKEMFVHLCSQKCLIDFAKSKKIKEKIFFADQQEEEPLQEEDSE